MKPGRDADGSLSIVDMRNNKIPVSPWKDAGCDVSTITLLLPLGQKKTDPLRMP